jgi:hypothetical protein
VLEDDGVDEPDDGLLVVGAGALQLAEALQEAAVVEGPGVRLVALSMVLIKCTKRGHEKCTRCADKEDMRRSAPDSRPDSRRHLKSRKSL